MSVHYIKSIAEVTAFLRSWNLENYYVVTDHNCNTHCVSKLFEHTAPQQTHIFDFKPGEKNKTLNTFENGIDFLTLNNLSRNDIILNIGGGLTTDLGGFIAACFKRGIDFINIPTSLLAQVDASHGGKVGVNHKHLKNYIGTFKPAKHTIVCPEFLQTLPQNELISGFAEMLKHGLIADQQYWNDLKSVDISSISNANWLKHIQTSIEIKSSIVKSDPFETGKRKTLNFGHTVGHAIESHLIKSNQTIPHGVAIAAGMVIESFIANEALNLPDTEYRDIHDSILNKYGKLPIHKSDINHLIDLMQADKKNDASTILMAIPANIGSCQFDVKVNTNTIALALNHYLNS